MEAHSRLSSSLSTNDPSESLPSHLENYPGDRARRIDRETERLHAEETRLSFQHTTYTGPAAPARDFPPEILANLMHWALGGPKHYLDDVERKRFLGLRQISRMWRRTAFSTPKLWRYLSVYLKHPAEILVENSQALQILRRRLDAWFQRAGAGAEVHLDLSDHVHPISSGVALASVILGLEERPYRLITVRLWKTIIDGTDLADLNARSPTVKNLSVRGGIKDMHIMFANLESLAVTSSTERWRLLHLAHHPCLRSLRLMGMSINVTQDFAEILHGVPMLEELILDNIFYPSKPSTLTHPPMPHLSLRRLVTASLVLSRWDTVTFPNLEFCQLIPVDDNFAYVCDPDFSESESLAPTGKFLAECNPKSLTLDAIGLDIDAKNLFTLLSPMPSLKSLRLANPALLLSEKGREWRERPSTTKVFCKAQSPIPQEFTQEPIPSPSATLSIYTPNDGSERETSCSQLSEVTQRGRVSVNLISVPQWKMEETLRGEFPMRNHEYEELAEYYGIS
ncbi:hypothetical protein BKA70DRAFT_1342049 [Coprinopsis sp. MPI-PUGE-AT-0042]|nr:hypothetical protein BKA70DRAFT_1342049 [Coprinopsis sp. MPI-PUGE-AT-0042]